MSKTTQTVVIIGLLVVALYWILAVHPECAQALMSLSPPSWIVKMCH
jgi:hypothetical protein